MSLAPETLKHNSLCIHHILMTNRTKLKAFKNQLFLNFLSERGSWGVARRHCRGVEHSSDFSGQKTERPVSAPRISSRVGRSSLTSRNHGFLTVRRKDCLFYLPWSKLTKVVCLLPLPHHFTQKGLPCSWGAVGRDLAEIRSTRECFTVYVWMSPECAEVLDHSVLTGSHSKLDEP